MRNKFTIASFSLISFTLFSFSFFKIEVRIMPGGPPAALAQQSDHLPSQAQADAQPIMGAKTNTVVPKYPERIEVSNPVTVKRIKFARGGTSSVITGSIGRASEHDFLLGARREQSMTVSLSSEGALFCVYAPDGTPLMEMSNVDWSGVLPQSGDYRIKVFANGREGQYSLDVSIR